MTRGEKELIRNRPCALCLSVPPFADGSRCHVHRIIRGKDGGQYEGENVIPLCPPCHRVVDRIAAITGARSGGLVGGRIGGPKGARRRHELYPQMSAENLRGWRERHPELVRQNSRKAAQVMWAKRTKAERSEIIRARWDVRRANRAAVMRDLASTPSISGETSGPMISCACGCGKRLLQHDRYGRPRRYINGHTGQLFQTRS